ncbi:iron chelate uptake ABC transporter family permease subunit [Plantibacter sp. T3]|uniref:FecCD family ABC transporter permease n=1 Tax=Plantibacter sp. T3 TaxID=2653161 RepID=UPI0012F01B20|nr:iron chelate uptake ABC transporter family permease subunit [Plantibacter sp. T3]VXB64712.1 iron-enterobactin transporter subunit; membrane component of ABC superfamily [Plantibacter sp. T3]
MTAVAEPGRRTVRIGRVSWVVHRRELIVVGALVAVIVGVGAFALTQGEYRIPLDKLLAAVTGTGSESVLRIVLEWRLPRVVIAVVGGIALGLSGAIFQSITRNPLGSPDIIGFNSGAFTGALIVTLVVGGNYAAMVSGALIGGLATALVVYLLAWSRGVQGFRLIVIGIAISAVLNAFNDYLQLRADLNAAIAAASWGMGSLADLGWQDVVPVTIAVAVLVPLLALMSRRLGMLEFGDDVASALGIPVERTRLLLLVIGVALTATVTAVAGPIIFVALAAPQLARRLTKSAGITLVPSAAMGAALLLVSDVVAQRIIAPAALPVGAVTVTLGGIYLIALLITQAGKR